MYLIWPAAAVVALLRVGLTKKDVSHMNGTLVQRMIAGGAVQGALALSLVALAVPAPIAAQYMPSQAPNTPPFFAIENARIVTGTGTVDASGCTCQAGFYLKECGGCALGNECNECMDGTDCQLPGVTLEALPTKKGCAAPLL